MSCTTLITGGAGFIGANLADRLLARGERVRVLDDLSRAGADRNVEWLRRRHGDSALDFRRADVRSAAAVEDAVRGCDRVAHLAGQVAVTSSVADPRADFEANALGTLNVLEALRAVGRGPILLYASTNKVYGTLADLALVEEESRYRFADLPHGVSEERAVDPVSPYGCSKAAGDCYARDYCRIFGVRTVVVRQSCVYGARQMGMEDQGWVAWLALEAVRGRPVRIFGDGKQVRDLLWIEDLLDAYDAVWERVDDVEGEAINLGGGPQHSLSVWRELGPLLEAALGRPVAATFHPWRPGDQRVYLSDVRKAGRLLGWQPRMSPEEGVRLLLEWARSPLATTGAR